MHQYLKLRASIIKMCKGFEESVFSILARLINGNPFIKENFASWTWALKIAINKYLSRFIIMSTKIAQVYKFP